MFLDRLDHDHYHAATIHRAFATLSTFAKYLLAAGVYNDETFPIPSAPPPVFSGLIQTHIASRQQ
jgi:site-specific recombinase XerD